MPATMKLCIILVGAVFCSAISGVYGRPGTRNKCPEVRVKGQLNLEQYLGHWHDIQRFPNDFQHDTICDTANYEQLNTTHVEVVNTATANNGSIISIKGVAYVPDPAAPAKFLVLFPRSSIPIPYWVLDTDYTNYAVVYSCINPQGNATIAQEFAWVLSRQPMLQEQFMEAARGAIQRNNVDPVEGVSRFMDTVQANCVNYRM
ncbi:putative Apolipoprotein D [Hypsibius exemplaris]|uniref:Apolipoprotein D n=1 Tax=Hypsibius exemplaris TaxID=2072580 RepID=A0A1W0WWR4_HYPEX|nr:putative Apolipoprotein D [Hypsibius exemplaris]